jgi:hypothetical protein
MATEQTPKKDPVPAAPRQPVKLRKFEAPAELAEKFGVQSQQEDQITGLVKTEDVRELLDTFGLQERSEVVFPFQHLKKQHGEIWGMRIEPLASHSIAGAPVVAHAWTFMQQYPERVGGTQ